MKKRAPAPAKKTPNKKKPNKKKTKNTTRSSRPAGKRKPIAPPAKAVARISTLITPLPHTIGCSQPLAKAHALMREHNIRHLPVLDGGKLVGMLSQRDLHLIETFRDVDPNEVRVDEAMSRDPYAVRYDAPIADVAKTMAQHKYGSAVVVDDDGQVLGVFTTVDALFALAAAIK